MKFKPLSNGLPAAFALSILASSATSLSHPMFHGEFKAPTANESSPEVARIPRTRSGYGFSGDSEAEAYALLDFQCLEPDSIECSSGKCATPEVAPASDSLLRTVGSDLMEASLLQRARVGAFEFLAMNLAHLDQSRQPLKVPSCLEKEPGLSTLFQRLPVERPADEVLSGMTPEQRQLIEKFTDAGTTLSDTRILKAMTEHDYLMAKSGKSKCEDVSAQSLPMALKSAPKQANLVDDGGCTAARNQLRRLHDSMPVLFRGDNGTTEKYEARIAPVRSAIHRMLGSRIIGASANGQTEAGGHLARASIHYSSAPAQSLNADLSERLRESRAQDPETFAGINLSLKDARENLNAALKDLRKDYKADLERSLRGLCDLSLKQIADTAPNVVRQMILDLPQPERRLGRNTICEAGLTYRFRSELQCGKFSKSSNGKETIYEIDRKFYSLPDATTNRFRIREPKPDSGLGPLIELVIDIESSLPPTEVAKIKSTWQEKANAWFNCQSGATPTPKPSGSTGESPCPSSSGMGRPPVRFNIEFQSTNKSPLVAAAEGTSTRLRQSRGSQRSSRTINVSRCVNGSVAGNSKTECDAVRAIVLESCMQNSRIKEKLSKSSERYAEIQKECEAKTAPSGDPSNNRPTSGVYTPDIKDETLFHELSHAMGLDDEYADSSAPFRALGEHDSIMNPVLSPPRLYPRHVEQVLSVMQCPDPKNSSQPKVTPRFSNGASVE